MSMSPRSCLACGAALGGIAVACGAFGAHGLADLLDRTGQATNWETACRYAMVHALALLAVGTLGIVRPAAAPRLAWAAWSFLLGSIVFSGCLAALALSGTRMLGAIVPVGGVSLIAGWIFLAAAATRVDA